MVIHRGEMWWVSMPDPKGSEPGYRRPLLIIQSNDFNKSKISTIIAIAITKNLKLSHAPGNVYLSKESTDLSKDSVANVSQVITINKNYLTECIGKVSPKIMKLVDEGLRLVLNL